MHRAAIISLAARCAMRWAEDPNMEDSSWEALIALVREQVDAAELAVARLQGVGSDEALKRGTGLAAIEALELAAFALMALVRAPGSDLLGPNAVSLERLT